MGSVYILRSKKNKRYYVGSTTDLRKRLEDHNSGKSGYTRLTKPFELVFFQDYPTILQARRIETKLKRSKSRSILEAIIKEGRIIITE